LDPSDATPTAVRVSILLDRVSGKVLDVSGASITLSGFKGAARDVVISPSTEYFSDKTAATGATVGQFVTAFGTPDATTPADLDALFVDIASTSAHPTHGTWVSPSHIDPSWGTPKGATPDPQVTPPVTPPVAIPAAPSVTSAVPTAPTVTPTWSGSGARTSPQDGQGDQGFPGLGSHNGLSGLGGPSGATSNGFSGGGRGPGSRG
jgi:hypothetical protein